MSEISAQWIKVAEAEVPAIGQRPVYWLRHEFDITNPTDAVLRISAQGMYEVFINGHRVGDEQLTPGYTQYNARIQYQSFDVAQYLVAGRNAIAVLLADGWFRGCVGIGQQVNHYGDHVALLAEICAGDACIKTDTTWKVSPSHITSADLMRGQHEDRRLIDTAVMHAGYDDAAWDAPLTHSVSVALVEPIAPPVRVVRRLQPKTVTRLSNGNTVVDFGENINGWIRLSNLGPAGTLLTLVQGEALDPATGDVTLENLGFFAPIVPEPIVCRQIDSVISAGVPGDVFEPHFTIKGFQYLSIQGHPSEISANDIEACFVHSDLEPIGGFTTSNQDLTWLHSAAVRSFLGNACEVPTDCPTRERSGWTGDWQVFIETAAYLFDVDAWSRRWLADVIIDQHESGIICNISPTDREGGFDGPLAGVNGSAGWGDAIVHVPWVQYQTYDSTEALERCWDAMQKWVDHAASVARDGRSASRTGEVQPHEKYLWDTGFHWGEWLEPGFEIHDFGAFAAADKSEVATAYLMRSATEIAEIAEILNKGADVTDGYRQLAAGARDAWRREFISADGGLLKQTQASHVRALQFGLLDEAERPRVAADLAAMIRANGNRLGTGFLSTVFLLPVLADNGHADVAFDLLFQRDIPSWLGMRDRGATTIWEAWNGIDENGRPDQSLNHYSKGAVISFLHQYVAGLKPTAPGYASFEVSPLLDARIKDAETWHRSPFGDIRVAWKHVGTDFTMDVQVPEGCTAVVNLPDGSSATISTQGTHAFGCSTAQ